MFLHFLCLLKRLIIPWSLWLVFAIYFSVYSFVIYVISYQLSELIHFKYISSHNYTLGLNIFTRERWYLSSRYTGRFPQPSFHGDWKKKCFISFKTTQKLLDGGWKQVECKIFPNILEPKAGISRRVLGRQGILNSKGNIYLKKPLFLQKLVISLMRSLYLEFRFFFCLVLRLRFFNWLHNRKLGF